VTVFLNSGLAATDPALVGEPYVDGSGNRYVRLCRQPIMIYAGDRPGLRRAYERAVAPDVERLALFITTCSPPPTGPPWPPWLPWPPSSTSRASPSMQTENSRQRARQTPRAPLTLVGRHGTSSAGRSKVAFLPKRQ
jgi:hypothetical protein